MAHVLTPALASTFACLALAGVEREWPHVYVHLVRRAKDLRQPREMHPAFYGCYDWHSAVHGHWTLARILRLHPSLPSAARIRAALNRNLTPKNLAAELAYFQSPGRGTFERPYGWAWLVALAAELRTGTDADSRRWARAIRPLEAFIAESLCAHLARQPYPIRSGMHSNTAFALVLSLDYAREVGDRRLEKAIISRSLAYFGADANAPVTWEPSGEDFLSPTLTEADLMARVLSPARFRTWLKRFAPGLVEGKPSPLMEPTKVLDRKDPRQVHLDGLCLSRAWALDRIASFFPAQAKIRVAAERNARAGLARVASGDYGGEHWLASFALYLITGG